MFKGEKVLLRTFLREDIPRLHAFAQDAELYLLDCDVPRPATLEAVQSIYENMAKPPDDRVFFAIEADGLYIGNVGLSKLQERHGNSELGIGIGDRAYWGRGYGRETVRLMLDYGFRLCGRRRIGLTTHAKNERALRCYRACGFVEEGRPRQVLWIDGEYVDLVNMSILRDEWERSASVSFTA